jgi:sortase A
VNGTGSASRRRPLRKLEWIFLLFGLVSVDTYLWINTNSLLYQAYQDWAFDETMRGLTPSVRRFAADEIYWAFGGARTKVDNAEGRKLEPLPTVRPPLPDSVIGRLSIPRLQLAVMVREGAGSGTLERAVGHIPGTAMPGKPGNVALAGHRDTFFRPLRNIQKNDTINLETERGTYRYQVESTQIVGPRDVGVLAAANHQSLTLVTCYPFYYVGSAPKRFIVRAVQVNADEVAQPAALPHHRVRESGRHASLTPHQQRQGS